MAIQCPTAYIHVSLMGKGTPRDCPKVTTPLNKLPMKLSEMPLPKRLSEETDKKVGGGFGAFILTLLSLTLSFSLSLSMVGISFKLSGTRNMLHLQRGHPIQPGPRRIGWGVGAAQQPSLHPEGHRDLPLPTSSLSVSGQESPHSWWAPYSMYMYICMYLHVHVYVHVYAYVHVLHYEFNKQLTTHK